MLGQPSFRKSALHSLTHSLRQKNAALCPTESYNDQERATESNYLEYGIVTVVNSHKTKHSVKPWSDVVTDGGVNVVILECFGVLH